MRSALFYLGRLLQIAGMATVFMSFVSLDDTGNMLKVAFVGVIEFYAGYLLVMGTGVE
jgi:uncharacterized membrane protein HdeD (DUF308 family)